MEFRQTFANMKSLLISTVRLYSVNNMTVYVWGSCPNSCHFVVVCVQQATLPHLKTPKVGFVFSITPRYLFSFGNGGWSCKRGGSMNSSCFLLLVQPMKVVWLGFILESSQSHHSSTRCRASWISPETVCRNFPIISIPISLPWIDQRFVYYKVPQ